LIRRGKTHHCVMCDRELYHRTLRWVSWGKMRMNFSPICGNKTLCGLELREQKIKEMRIKIDP